MVRSTPLQVTGGRQIAYGGFLLPSDPIPFDPRYLCLKFIIWIIFDLNSHDF